MDAGMELDFLVLEKVMGGRLFQHKGKGMLRALTWYAVVAGEAPDPSPYGGDNSADDALAVAGCKFSRFYAAAMRVVDEMVRRGFTVHIQTAAGFGEAPRGWLVEFGKDGPDHFHRWGAREHLDLRVAICLAALQAVADDVDVEYETMRQQLVPVDEASQ